MIVRQVLKSKATVAVLVLGGSHDLADNVKRLTAGEVRLVVVTCKAYREASGEGEPLKTP